MRLQAQHKLTMRNGGSDHTVTAIFEDQHSANAFMRENPGHFLIGTVGPMAFLGKR